MSYTKQEHLALNEHLGPPGYFDGLRVAHLFSFLYSPCMCLMYLVLWCDVHYVVCINPCLVRLYPHLFVLFMLFVFAVYSAVQPNIDCMSYIAGVLSRVHYPCCSSFYYFCFVLSYYVSLLSKFCFFYVRYDFQIRNYFRFVFTSCVFVGGLQMPYLRYLFLFA